MVALVALAAPPGAAVAADPGEAPTPGGTPVTVPAPEADPVAPQETTPDAESSITITIPPEQARSGAAGAARPTPAAAPPPVVTPRAAPPASVAEAPRRSNRSRPDPGRHEDPSARSSSEAPAAGENAAGTNAAEAWERARRAAKLQASRARLEANARARAERRKAAARLSAARERLAAASKPGEGAFTPPLRGEPVATTTTAADQLPLPALATVLAGLLLFVGAGMVPDRALVHLGRGGAHTLWLGAIALGLTFVLVGSVMLVSSL